MSFSNLTGCVRTEVIQIVHDSNDYISKLLARSRLSLLLYQDLDDLWISQGWEEGLTYYHIRTILRNYLKARKFFRKLILVIFKSVANLVLWSLAFSVSREIHGSIRNNSQFRMLFLGHFSICCVKKMFTLDSHIRANMKNETMYFKKSTTSSISSLFQSHLKHLDTFPSYTLF